jgi:putative ABC transport system substrate-binding protein
MTDRKRVSCTVVWGLLAVLVFGASPPLSQQSSKPIRVALFASGFASEYAGHERGLVAGLRERGYVEGKNLIVERRYGQLERDRITGLAQELAGLELDAIVTVCTITTRAARNATTSTPIVMLSVSDPVGQGLATSLSHPGTNVTGLTNRSRELVPKLLELFHDAVPKANRIAVLVNTGNPLHEALWTEALAASHPVGVSLIRISARLPAGFDDAMEAVEKSQAEALFVLPDDPPSLHLRSRLAEFANKRALPLFGPYGEVFQSGALLSYGESLEVTARKSATYIEKIARGASAAELPIEQPTRFELSVNLRVAKQLGIDISPSVLVRADKLIE